MDSELYCQTLNHFGDKIRITKCDGQSTGRISFGTWPIIWSQRERELPNVSEHVNN